MRYLIVDVETTIYAKGNPFSKRNQLCYIGAKFTGQPAKCFDLVHRKQSLDEFQSMLDNADYLVAFNAKFDCHWLERVGFDLSRHRIWDCQYAEFIFNQQRPKYPSLEDSSIKYGLGHKLDTIKEEFWNKGIDTIDIPPEIMIQYLEQDLNLTDKLFQIQQAAFQDKERSKWRLFQLHMEDQVVLREMERNGILYDTEKSLALEKQLSNTIADIDRQLMVGYEGIPINFGSPDQLSAYLYGGTISVDTRIPVGVYKTGAKVGQTRYKIVTHEYKLPRLIEPINGSELKKEGVFSTDEYYIRQLRPTGIAKARIGLLNERSKQEKLRGTYYGGFPKKLLEMEWSDNYLHPTLNQCVAITGRLSSANPKQ